MTWAFDPPYESPIEGLGLGFVEVFGGFSSASEASRSRYWVVARHAA